MKNKTFLSLICLFTLTSAHAYESAYRDLKTDYTVYEKKVGPIEEREATLGRSALGSSQKYTGDVTTKATSWASVDVMQKRFEQIRDEKFLVWRDKPEIMRRSSWFYPDDGCYARAALAVRNAFRWFHPLPNKVFVFGNLRVKTNNSPRGVVGWWYHVAPIVEVAGTKYVLDPAIEFTKPLPLHDWLLKMGKPEKMKVSICGPGTYSPGDSCSKETDGLEIRAENAQQSYLTLEWKRMQRLGRESEL